MQGVGVYSPPKPRPLTARQLEALEFISGFCEGKGYSPTVREVMRGLGMRSANGANDHIKALERKGYLKREPLKSRTMRIVRMPESRASFAALAADAKARDERGRG